jgi:hypothetical protein
MSPTWIDRRCSEALVATLVGVALTVAGPTQADSARLTRESPWAAHVRTVDSALAARDIGAAERAWHAAYLAALGSWRWEGMVEVGDAAVRIGEASRLRQSANAKARNLYVSALFRARQQDSLEGVLRVAEAFAALGDREVVAQCVRIALRLAAQDPEAQADVRAFVARLGDPYFAAGQPGR